MNTPNFSICIYCGSRAGSNPAYEKSAIEVGKWIGHQGGQLVYGGGRTGLMGIVANATKSAGGRVVGVIPQALVDKELANDACDELHIVANMHERKAMMAERSHAFLALPGGIGTFEELFEIWTWRQLGYHGKPIGLLNIENYYNPLIDFLQSTTDQGFMQAWQMSLIQHTDNSQEILKYLVEHSRPNDSDETLRSVI